MVEVVQELETSLDLNDEMMLDAIICCFVVRDLRMQEISKDGYTYQERRKEDILGYLDRREEKKTSWKFTRSEFLSAKAIIGALIRAKGCIK